MGSSLENVIPSGLTSGDGTRMSGFAPRRRAWLKGNGGQPEGRVSEEPWPAAKRDLQR